MLRLLILLLLGFAIWLLIKRVSRRPRDGSTDPQQAGRAPEPMLACSLCGLHVPKSEGTMRDGEFFCCEAHSRRSDERDRG